MAARARRHCVGGRGFGLWARLRPPPLRCAERPPITSAERSSTRWCAGPLGGRRGRGTRTACGEPRRSSRLSGAPDRRTVGQPRGGSVRPVPRVPATVTAIPPGTVGWRVAGPSEATRHVLTGVDDRPANMISLRRLHSRFAVETLSPASTALIKSLNIGAQCCVGAAPRVRPVLWCHGGASCCSRLAGVLITARELASAQSSLATGRSESATGPRVCALRMSIARRVRGVRDQWS